jgi:hypothetical protein
MGGYVGAGLLAYNTAYDGLHNAIMLKNLDDYKLPQKLLKSALDEGI